MRRRVRAECSAHRTNDGNRELPSALGRAPEEVGSPVGPRCGELIQQVPLGAHDLDAVVSGLHSQLRGGTERSDELVDLCGRQLPGVRPAYRRRYRRGRNRVRNAGVAPGMQQLQDDPGPLLVDGGAHLAVLVQVVGSVQGR